MFGIDFGVVLYPVNEAVNKLFLAINSYG
jgi:hypothetical protein